MDQSNARGAPPWQAPPYQAGQPFGAAPANQYPDQGTPAAQYPAAQYPAAQYPAAQYPGTQYAAPGYPGAQPPAAQYPAGQYPVVPYQGRQAAPGRYAPQQYRPYGQPAAAAALGPRLEVELADDRPYVQENVLLRLRVVSSGNLATASPDLVGIDEALFEKVQGPNTSVRGSGNSREIINEFVMAMTPLRDGDLEIGPLKVTGTLAGGMPFEAVAPEPLRLQVRPPMAAVRPWLPLQTLQIKAELDNDGELERGRPVTLTLELEAEGATGDQLPSLEAMLRSDDFRVYREQTMTDTRLAPNGNTLIGKRIEYYTLVPQTGGRLQLPELRLGWWNVDTATREASSVPIRTITVAGASGPFGFSRASERGDDAGWSPLWLPLIGLLLLLTGYWGGVWLRNRPIPDSGPTPRSQWAAVSGPLLPRLTSALATAAGNAGRALGAQARLLDPTPLLRRARSNLARLTPKSTRVYQCARVADRADDPASWCLAFQRQAGGNLQTSAREPLPRMADRIVSQRPGADRARVLQLMQQLDAALYNRQDIDFARWKREFRRALRPGTGMLRSLVADHVRRGHLPALNPQPQRA